jgi:hypothetical protein
LQRFSLTGARELCYPAGAVVLSCGSYQENANGTAIVFGTGDGMKVVSSAGQLVGDLSTQYGRGIVPDAELVEQRQRAGGLLGTAAGLPAVRGPARAGDHPRDPGGFVGAWHLPSGTYAEAGACGSTWLERLNPDGTATILTIPGVLGGGRVRPLGVYGDQLPLLVAGGCARYPYSFVEWYNPAANVARPVLGGPAGGGYVIDAILFQAS